MSAPLSSDPRHDSPAADSPITELIRLAGYRPQPSEPRTVQARTAVEVEWQRTVRRRRIRRSLWRLATTAVALLSLAWVARVSFRSATPERSSSPVLATVVTVREPVRVREGGSDARPILAGEGVGAGAVIDSGAGGRAAFRLGDGTSIRLDVDTRIVLESASRLRLARGAVYIDSNGRRDAAGLHVHTAQGIVRDIGTQFEVRAAADSGIRIRVREGDVRLDRTAALADSAPVLVTQAEEVHVGGTGGVERRAIPRHGPEWSWVETIAPPFDIEGASLESFLQWVGREAGLTWRFKDDAAATYGSRVVLHGSIDGLTPAEALDAVMPTCGMTHLLRRGQLVVSLASR